MALQRRDRRLGDEGEIGERNASLRHRLLLLGAARRRPRARSTSTIVVQCAEVRRLSSMCSAIRRRIGDIASRRAARSPPARGRLRRGSVCSRPVRRLGVQPAPASCPAGRSRGGRAGRACAPGRRSPFPRPASGRRRARRRSGARPGSRSWTGRARSAFGPGRRLGRLGLLLAVGLAGPRRRHRSRPAACRPPRSRQARPGSAPGGPSRRRDLDVHLVGGDFADRLVGLDPVAGPLQPLDDRALGDRDAHLRHRHLDQRAQ